VLPLIEDLTDDRVFTVRERAAKGMGAVFLKLMRGDIDAKIE
jgi:hypothetical protein